MAATAWRFLVNDKFAEEVKLDFEKDREQIDAEKA